MSESPRLQPPGSNALFGWMRHYRRAWLAGDLTAGLVVGIMIIPQSMAYAMLAGLPVQIGLYASLLPLLDDPASVVRGSAIWALARLDRARFATEKAVRMEPETDPGVLAEWMTE